RSRPRWTRILASAEAELIPQLHRTDAAFVAAFSFIASRFAWRYPSAPASRSQNAQPRSACAQPVWPYVSCWPREQVAFPMAWNGTVLDFGRTFADGNRIDDLSRQPAWRGATFRIAHTPPCPKMPDQLFLENAARL